MRLIARLPMPPALLLACCLQASAAVPPGDAFERTTPAEAGYSEARLEALRDFLSRSGSDSLLLLHDGKVFFEWGDIRRKLFVHSIRKSLLNSLVGAHLGEGCLVLDRTLGELGIDDIAPGLTPMEKTATLEQVLQSRSGVYHPSAAESEGMSGRRPARGSHPPGTHFYYNNWDFNVAGAVFEQCTGRSIYDAFHDDIATPLGMLDYANKVVSSPPSEAPFGDVDGVYQLEAEHSRYPAYHFRLSAHDLALYGQLYLQHGQWQGHQLVPAEWIDRSTQPISITEPEYGLGYGMLWGVVVPDDPSRRASFYHTGSGVHMLGVYPEQGLVMVHRVDTDRDYTFHGGDLYQVIRRVHGARIQRPANEVKTSSR